MAKPGINLWTIDEGTISLTNGTAQYTLPANAVDLLEQVIRTGSGSTQQDLTINRISVSTALSQTRQRRTAYSVLDRAACERTQDQRLARAR